MTRSMPWFACRIILALSCGMFYDVQAMSCTPLSASRFNFGAYQPLSVRPHDVEATYVIQCTPAYAGEPLKLKLTLILGNAGGGQWDLYRSGPGAPLRFSLYRDPARQVSLDPRVPFEFSTQLNTMQEFPITNYGRIPARQNVAAGSYQASMTLLVEY